MLAQGSLHLNLCFVPLLPLIVVAIDDLVVSGRHSTRRAGLTLGGLATAQYFISSELLADLGVLAVIGVVVLAARYPRQARARLRRVAGGVGWALVPFVLLCGYPLVFGLVGPEHVVGSEVDPTLAVDGYRNDLFSPLVPTTGQLLAPGRWGLIGRSYVPGGEVVQGKRLPGPENGGYLGIPLVACWVASTIWALLARNGRALLLALLAALAFVLSLGPKLRVDGRATAISMPFKLLASVSAFDLSVPVRFAVLADLAVTVTVAIAFDALISWLGRRHGSWSLKAVVPVPALLSAAVLAPLLPSAPVVSAAVGLPSYFSSPAVKRIAAGATVLAYPYPESGDNQAMVWQFASGFRFRIIGGYVLTPWNPKAPHVAGGGGYGAPVLTPSVVPQVLFEVAFAHRALANGLFPVVPGSEDDLRTFIRRYHVGDIVAAPLGRDVAYVVYFLTASLREKPVDEDGVEVWYDVQRSLLLRDPPLLSRAVRTQLH
jgi:hypothetical protein